MPHFCAICEAQEVESFVIGGARRIYCSACRHEQRADIEVFDYIGFAMGATGAATARLQDQADFLARHMKAEDRVLEIGCAAGLLAQVLQHRVDIQRYDGLELSPARGEAKLCMDIVYDAGLPGLLADGRVAPGAYDFVISSHCLEHIPDVNAEIAAIRQVLSEAGRFFVEVPNRSGHPALPFDDNRSHLHFFSVTSLVGLLTAHGFEIEMLVTGAWHDARYPDCIRAVARVARHERKAPCPLLAGAALGEADNVIVWGAGRMAEEMLAHFFDPAKILFFVDKDERKQEKPCLGRPVMPIQSIAAHPGCTVLVNSLEYEESICAEISALFGGVIKKAIRISDLLEGNF